MNNVNHKKIYAVLIICVAFIFSTFLLARKPTIKKDVGGEILGESGIDVRPEIAVKDNSWSEILQKNTRIATSSQKINYGPDDFNPNLPTARMGRELLSRYISSSQKGQQMSEEQIQQIVVEMMSNPDYNKIDAVVYVQSNLKTTSSNTPADYKKYNQDFNDKMAKRLIEIQNVEDPIAIMLKVTETDDPNYLKPLGTIVSALEGSINDLRKVSVPTNLVQIHLGVLNALSALLSDVEAMKKIYTDPVSSMSAISQYEKHITDFSNALGILDSFFKKI